MSPFKMGWINIFVETPYGSIKTKNIYGLNLLNQLHCSNYTSLACKDVGTNSK